MVFSPCCEGDCFKIAPLCACLSALCLPDAPFQLLLCCAVDLLVPRSESHIMLFNNVLTFMFIHGFWLRKTFCDSAKQYVSQNWANLFLQIWTLSKQDPVCVLKTAFQHRDDHTCIVLMTNHLNHLFACCLSLTRTKALVLELLAAVCLVRGGHEIILSAFDNFKTVNITYRQTSSDEWKITQHIYWLIDSDSTFIVSDREQCSNIEWSITLSDCMIDWFQVCSESMRFEKLMEHFKNEDDNIDFLVWCFKLYVVNHLKLFIHFVTWHQLSASVWVVRWPVCSSLTLWFTQWRTWISESICSMTSPNSTWRNTWR